MKRLLKICDIAELLNCSTKTVRRMVERGAIPAIQPGGPGSFIRFDQDEVLSALRETPTAVGGAALTNTEPRKRPGPTPNWKKKLEKRKAQQ